MKKKIALAFIIGGLVLSRFYIGSPDNMPLDQKRGTFYIEICKGQCVDNNGNGIILNTESDCNYIAYNTNTEAGENVTSLFIYNPLTSWNDDVIARFDF